MYAEKMGSRIYTLNNNQFSLSLRNKNHFFGLPLFSINTITITKPNNRTKEFSATKKKPSSRILHISASTTAHTYGYGNITNNNINSSNQVKGSGVSAFADGSSPVSDGGGDSETAKGSGTTARGRRLLKVREEKRKREYDRVHNYPSWAKVLENACKDDTELRAVLGDSIGDPELMRKRVEERVRTKGRDFSKQKSGSVVSFKVSFRDFNPLGSHIWFELYGSPSDRDVDLIGSVIQAWYVMGRLGAFNSSNLQLGNTSMEYDPVYDAEKGSRVMPSSFHDIGNVEFQDNWGRVWVDLGTSDFFCIDILLNCLTVMSSEYVGIQQVVFGGRNMGDWEEGMINPDYGFKYFKV